MINPTFKTKATQLRRAKFIKKRRTPQEQKRLRYTKDHVVLAEYPHLFRKSWPKKKAGRNQVYRRKVRQALIISPGETPDAQVLQSEAQTIRRKPILRWGAVSLQERVAIKLRIRRSRLGWDFFTRPYSTARDREHFVAFLTALTAGKSNESAKYALVVSEWIDPSSEPQSPWLKVAEKRQWLRAFFRDEPEWEARLRNWIDSRLEAMPEE